MKQRVLAIIGALVCTMALSAAGIAPAHANVPPSGDNAVIQAEQFRWYFRNNNGVDEMRLWSITKGEWVTDWVPVPDGWSVPGT